MSHSSLIITSICVLAPGLLAGCSPSGGEAAASSVTPKTTTGAQTQAGEPASPAAPATTIASSDNDADAGACTDDKLRARATSYWSAKQAEDCRTLFGYEILTEETKDATVEEFCDWFNKEEPFQISHFEIRDAIVDGSCEYGWVELSSRTTMRQFPNIPPREVDRWEKWVVHQEAWKPVPRAQLEAIPEPPVIRNAAEESILRDRYEHAWDAKVAGDWNRLLELTDPADREAIPLEQYLQESQYIIYLSHDVAWAQDIGDRGVVRDAIEHKINDPNMIKLPPGVAVVNEKWIKRDGEWFIDMNPSN